MDIDGLPLIGSGVDFTQVNLKYTYHFVVNISIVPRMEEKIMQKIILIVHISPILILLLCKTNLLSTKTTRPLKSFFLWKLLFNISIKGW